MTRPRRSFLSRQAMQNAPTNRSLQVTQAFRGVRLAIANGQTPVVAERTLEANAVAFQTLPQPTMSTAAARAT